MFGHDTHQRTQVHPPVIARHAVLVVRDPLQVGYAGELVGTLDDAEQDTGVIVL